MLIRLSHCVVAIVVLAGPAVAAQRQQSVQVDVARERARQPYQAGLQHLQMEAFDAAVKSFEQAIDLDPTFDMAYYMLGRTHMMTKSYAAAVAALTKCRDLHLAESRNQLLDRQDLQHQRRRRLDEMNEQIGRLEQAIRAGGQDSNRDRYRAELAMLEERKRQIQDAERQLPTDQAVPAFVSLSLGSAYFRSGKLAEAEEAYRATVAADPKVGEAYSNLAVVYMETRRFDEAERAIREAEKTGFRVAPALKEEIKKRKSGTD